MIPFTESSPYCQQESIPLSALNKEMGSLLVKRPHPYPETYCNTFDECSYCGISFLECYGRRPIILPCNHAICELCNKDYDLTVTNLCKSCSLAKPKSSLVITQNLASCNYHNLPWAFFCKTSDTNICNMCAKACENAHHVVVDASSTPNSLMNRSLAVSKQVQSVKTTSDDLLRYMKSTQESNLHFHAKAILELPFIIERLSSIFKSFSKCVIELLALQSRIKELECMESRNPYNPIPDVSQASYNFQPFIDDIRHLQQISYTYYVFALRDMKFLPNRFSVFIPSIILHYTDDVYAITTNDALVLHFGSELPLVKGLSDTDIKNISSRPMIKRLELFIAQPKSVTKHLLMIHLLLRYAYDNIESLVIAVAINNEDPLEMAFVICLLDIIRLSFNVLKTLRLSIICKTKVPLELKVCLLNSTYFHDLRQCLFVDLRLVTCNLSNKTVAIRTSNDNIGLFTMVICETIDFIDEMLQTMPPHLTSIVTRVCIKLFNISALKVAPSIEWWKQVTGCIKVFNSIKSDTIVTDLQSWIAHGIKKGHFQPDNLTLVTKQKKVTSLNTIFKVSTKVVKIRTLS
jgi:hypothetical protein